MSSFFFTCREAIDRLTDLQEHALGAGASLRVKAHMAMCPPCKAVQDALAELPGLVREAMDGPDPVPEALQAQLRDTLDRAIARLKADPAACAAPPEDRLPAPVRQAAAAEGGPAWQLFLETWRTLAAEGPGQDETGLPDAVLASLPPKSQWSWKRLGFSGTRVARLLEDAAHRADLVLLHIAPHGRIPEHTHLGAEAVLVLDGEMDEADLSLTSGDCHAYAKGSRHTQQVGASGCWCLMRLEQPGFRLHGVQSLLG